MADGATTDTSVQTPTTEPASADPAPTPAEPAAAAVPFDRNAPAFKAVTKQVEEERAARAELQAKLDEILNKEKKEQEAAELKALEERGQYEAIMAKKEAELEAMRAAHARAMIEADLKVRLFSAGATNETFISGAVANFDGDAAALGEYVDGLKALESNAPFFGIVQEQAARGLPATKGGTPATSAQRDWKQIKRDLTDPAKAAEASKRLTEFAAANDGALPPGF